MLEVVSSHICFKDAGAVREISAPTRESWELCHPFCQSLALHTASQTANRKRRTPDANANANANMNQPVNIEVLGGDICTGAFLEGRRGEVNRGRAEAGFLEEEFLEVQEEDPSRTWQEGRVDEGEERTKVKVMARRDLTSPASSTSSALLSTPESGSFTGLSSLKNPLLKSPEMSRPPHHRPFGLQRDFLHHRLRLFLNKITSTSGLELIPLQSQPDNAEAKHMTRSNVHMGSRMSKSMCNFVRTWLGQPEVCGLERGLD